MDKVINNNGYDYIDLGLPSGTLWATCNIGASKPTDYGYYFQWGETHPCYTNKLIHNADWTNYKFNPSGDGVTFTKYNYTDNKTVLDLEDDAAHVIMGGDWRMPTKEDINELIGLTNKWVENYNGSGVNGRLFTGKNGKEIFIPAAGFQGGSSLGYVGSELNVWSSTLHSDIPRYTISLNSYSGYIDWDDYYRRCNGFSVRGVIKNI